MLTHASIRRLLRCGHFVAATYLGTYVYSPFHADPLWTDLGRYVAFPFLSLSGLWMWQQARVARWTRRARPDTRPA